MDEIYLSYKDRLSFFFIFKKILNLSSDLASKLENCNFNFKCSLSSPVCLSGLECYISHFVYAIDPYIHKEELEKRARNRRI